MKLIHKNTDGYYSNKRLRKNNKRKIIKSDRSRLEFLKKSQLSLTFGRQSKVIKMISLRATKTPIIKKHRIHVDLGTCFSIIENPEETISLLIDFAKALDSEPNIREIRFHYSDLKHYNLAANALLDLITVEKKLENKNRRSRKRLIVRGNYPRDEAVKLFIKSMGIIKHLDIKHETLTSEESKKIIFFDYRNCHYYQSPDGRKAGFKEKKIQQFVDYIEKCLNDKGLGLSELGQQELVNYTGEIVSNAEEHSGFVDWTIQGYLDRTGEVPICELVIFNFGRSIAESIMESRKSNSYLESHIGPYIDKHKSHGFFGHGWSEEDLCTVVALQAHVSSKNNTNYDTRGQGTVDMIRFLEQLNALCSLDEKPKMAILSGSTHILFDGTYSLLEREDSGPIIAFNKSNDLGEKPDEKYVRNLKNAYFPGTIISIKFQIKRSSFFEETDDDE